MFKILSLSLLFILSALKPIIEACSNGLDCDTPTPRPTAAPIVTSKLEFENVILFEYGKKAEIILREGNDATQDEVCRLTIDYLKRRTEHINFKHHHCENDETRSLQITRALAGTKIRLFDNPDGHRNDDWVEITILKDFTTTKTVGGYERTEENEFIKQEFHRDNGLDGKVSRIEIEPPERIPDAIGFVDTRFDAATKDRLTKFISMVWRFDDVVASISSLQSYLKTEFDAQTQMINTRFGESTSNINYQFTESTDNINHKFTESKNNINNKFTESRNNVNNQFTFSTNNINNQFRISTNNINDKYNALSDQVKTRMNSFSHSMNQNFIKSTNNINYQFGVSTNNINQKYNLLASQMNIQSSMITLRFNTLAYGLRKNISATIERVREGNVDIINEIQATTNEIEFQLKQDINYVNNTVNSIEVEVNNQKGVLKQIKNNLDNYNVLSAGKTEMNMININKEEGLFEIKPSDLCIFGTVFIGLNMIFMGLMMIVFMKCYSNNPSVPRFAPIPKYDYNTSDIEIE